jgi:hypothetical protein
MGVATAVGFALALPVPAGAADNAPDSSSGDVQQPGSPTAQYYEQKIREQQELLDQQNQVVQQLQDLLKRQNARLNKLEQTVAQPQTPTFTPAASSDTPSGNPAESAAPQVGQTQPTPVPEAQPGGAITGQAPIGQAPAPPTEEERRPQVPSLPEIGGVLTPENKLSVEPSIEYDRVSTNQLTFRGISIVNGILVGAISSSDIRNDTVIGALTGRYGITNRLEAEIKVPYVARWNTETDETKAAQNSTFQNSISGNDIGDVEAAIHYQINDGLEDWPVFVGNFRYKSNTGTGPFDVPFSAAGLPTQEATGSGANTLEPSLTILYPSDPVVLFANVEYDYSIPYNPNKTIVPGSGSTAPTVVNRVEPGWAVGGTLGMGVSLNEKLSLTLGYEHFYVSPVITKVNGLNSETNALQVGSYLFGGSYQFTPNWGINFQALVGATRDAPDVRLIVRMPYTFDLN